METFLSTVQEPFYLLQRSIQEFHNIRGASKNSIMTGSPPPLFPMRRPPCPVKTLPRSGAMNTMIPRPHLLKSCKRPMGWWAKSLKSGPPPHQLVNHTTDLVIFQEDDPLSFPAVDGPMYCISPSPDGDIYNTIIDNGMNADAQILCSISALFLPSYKV